MDPITLGLSAGGALAGLLGKRKKPKGVQKQFSENIGTLNQQLLPYIQAYANSVYGAAGMQGSSVAQALQRALGRAGTTGSGAGAVAQGLGKAYAGQQSLVQGAQARYQGQSGLLQQAAQLAIGAGAQAPAGPTPFETFLSNLGAYLTTQGGPQSQAQQAYGAFNLTPGQPLAPVTQPFYQYGPQIPQMRREGFRPPTNPMTVP